jgi:transcriptional regulator with XRE-family HTH domain
MATVGSMAWSPENRRARHPEIQAGWELIGAMVKRRRYALGWTQRELSWRCGLDQAAICRLERGTVHGLRFRRFVAIVAAMNGLDVNAPAPERRPRVIDLFGAPDTPPGDGPLPDWLPHRDGGHVAKPPGPPPPPPPDALPPAPAIAPDVAH